MHSCVSDLEAPINNLDGSCSTLDLPCKVKSEGVQGCQMLESFTKALQFCVSDPVAPINNSDTPYSTLDIPVEVETDS